ncbi:hypothetical protein XELAEV_18039740mg [Xenopus laevis]|uniref:Uncharacterized protein n=1 Tax=Xenopus laevis TaxID=8355 RepID=A0A974C8C8_XENLA|nr:hypothetical protein XELAEV_18039740mg [Xenopus laevis]
MYTQGVALQQCSSQQYWKDYRLHMLAETGLVNLMLYVKVVLLCKNTMLSLKLKQIKLLICCCVIFESLLSK